MIEIIKESKGNLFKQIYRFDITNNDIVLQEYMEFDRPTRKHKYRMGKLWISHLKHIKDFNSKEIKTFILTTEIIRDVKDIMQQIIDKSTIKLE